MPKVRYTVGYSGEVAKPLTGHSLIIAKVMETEIGPESLSNQTLNGLIRIISDAQGFGKYVNIDQVLEDLKTSGFLIEEP